MEDDHIVGSGGVEQNRSFIDLRQRGGRRPGRERLYRERVEGRSERPTTLLLRARRGLRDERLMTDVYAVEDTDRDGERAAWPSVEVSEHAHER
jgi:hypothetical protein